MKRIKHWQDAANAILGAWLVVSPWPLAFQGVTVATVTTMAIGVLLVASSVGAMQLPAAWEEWMDAALGVLLWLPPVIQQLTGENGNLRILYGHFTDPPEEAVGFGAGIRVLLVHLNPWRLVSGK